MGTADLLPYAESGWERSVELPASTTAFVEEILARWPELAGEPHLVLGGGLRTLHLRFGARVARIALAPENDLRKEAALLRLVAPHVCVPRVLDGDERVLLLEYVPHVELPATVQAAKRVGRAAAKIHAHRFERSGILDGDLGIPAPFPSALEGLRAWGEEVLAGRAGERLGTRAAEVRALWRKSETMLHAACAQPSLVHADFKPANVKWLPDENDVLVLDWEFAWSGPALMDIGQFLRWGAPGPFVAALVRSYRETGGELPGGWRRTGELLDLFNLVGMLGEQGERPIKQADLLRRVEETLRRG